MLSADKRSGQNLDRWTEENWEEEMMKHPMFVTQDAIDKGEMSPVIQVLKYNAKYVLSFMNIFSFVKCRSLSSFLGPG